MFLNTFNAGAPFTFSRETGTSFTKAAVESELAYLAGLDASDVRIEESGSFLVLDGSVASAGDLSRVMRVATEIAGREHVICQLAVVGPPRKLA